MTLREFQDIIESTYGARDRARGLDATLCRVSPCACEPLST